MRLSGDRDNTYTLIIIIMFLKQSQQVFLQDACCKKLCTSHSFVGLPWTHSSVRPQTQKEEYQQQMVRIWRQHSKKEPSYNIYKGIQLLLQSVTR